MPRRRKESVHLDPETRRGIAVVFLFAIAVLLLLSIFDLAGAFGQAIDQGISHVFGWDQRDDAGHRAASGIYFVQAVAPGHKRQAQRMVLLR